MVISEARLPGSSKGLIWGIVGASLMVLVVSALVSGIVLPGLIMATGIVSLTWTTVRMTVSVAIAEEKIVLRCTPFYSTELSVSDVLAIRTAPATSLSAGYGYRIMGKKPEACWLEGLRSLLKRRPTDGSSQPPIPKRSYQQSKIKLRLSEQCT